MLALGLLKDYTQEEIKKHIINEYHGTHSGWFINQSFSVTRKKIKEDLKDAEILVAYEYIGDYGCDSNGFFLYEKNGKLYTNYSSHCSCYGMEGQWDPEETDPEFLNSEHFTFYSSCYDENSQENDKLVKKEVKRIASDYL